MDPSQTALATAVEPAATKTATVIAPQAIAAPSLVTPTATTAASVPAHTPFWEVAAFWSALPGLMWAVLVTVGLLYFRSEIGALFRAVAARVRDGSQVKIGGLEIAQSSGLFAHQGKFTEREDSRVGVYQDTGSRAAHRDSLYKDARGAMLVHRIQRSPKEGQLYDILIYVVPHKDSGLNGIVSVEYFLGKFWGDRVYPSSDRARGFPLVTSAYGPFICTAKLKFNDGTESTISRYIDFEMGHVAPVGHAAG